MIACVLDRVPRPHARDARPGSPTTLGAGSRRWVAPSALDLQERGGRV